MAERFRHLLTNDIVEAHQIPEGCRDKFINYEGEDDVAEGGDWLITYPFYERVDDQSFHEDYEGLAT